MLYEAVEKTLQQTVDWLQKGNDARSWWDAHTDHAEMCLFEIVRMSQRITDPTKRSGWKSTSDPPQQTLVRALPHVQNMVAAMRKRDRAAALKSGRAALAQMKTVR